MALTYSKPVIEPSIGLISEYVNADCAVMYEPNSGNALFDSLEHCLESVNVEAMSLSAKRQAQKFDWEIIAGKIAYVYNMDVP